MNLLTRIVFVRVVLVIYLHGAAIGFGVVRQTSSVGESLDHFVDQ